MDNVTLDSVVFVAVILVRFGAALFIPKFPLPAIIVSLVVDAVDRDIYEAFTSLDLDAYQGIDKALDIFYLTIAMLAVLRNWTQQTAARTARFLFYYRLVGVMLFELTGWRALLVVFPNTFEYFFIFYELIRARRSPNRMSDRFYIVGAALIWVVVKLPQEYWIHVAQLDFTETVADLVAAGGAVVVVAALVLVVAVAFGLRVAARTYIAPPEHRVVLAADPLPESIDEAHERALLRGASWSVLDANLLEKVALVSLVSVIFGSVLPSVTATPLQLTLGVAIVATFNSFLTVRAARAGRSMESVLGAFAVLALFNAAFVIAVDLLLGRSDGRLAAGPALFFLLLLTLLVLLYDRFRPVYDVRFSEDARVG